ncbi:hypothetical protein LEP1GSC124_0460, partial [Leptospira interrogans serovar Pyrogenes str. 200701872]
NILFLIASDCETRFPLLLSKLLLASSPSLSDSELQNQISHLGYSYSEPDQTSFRKYISRHKSLHSIPEIPPGEFSVSIHIARESKRPSTLKYKIKYEPGAENLTQIKAVPYSEEENKKYPLIFSIFSYRRNRNRSFRRYSKTKRVFSFRRIRRTNNYPFFRIESCIFIFRI